MKYNFFNDIKWAELKEQAETSPRKRAHHNLHESYTDVIQKTVICLLNGTYIPPHYHRHPHQNELFIILEGQIKVIIFEINGDIKEVIYLDSNEQNNIFEIYPNTIHTVVCLSKYAHILEIKQGPFIADDCKEFLPWTVLEESPEGDSYVKWLEAV